MPYIPSAALLQDVGPIPYCSVMNSLNQTITKNIATRISFDMQMDDAMGMHTPAQPTRITIPVAGVYLIHANVRWEANGTGHRTMRILQNGVVIEEIVDDASTGGNNTNQQIESGGRLAVGQYLEVEVEQNASPADLDSLTGPHVPHFAVIWQGL